MTAFLLFDPDTPEETELKECLVALQAEYHERANAILAALESIRRNKKPRVIDVHDFHQTRVL